jgi:hypothetical protein
MLKNTYELSYSLIEVEIDYLMFIQNESQNKIKM